MVRMDADDWSYPDRLELQIEPMEDHHEVVVSESNVEVCNSQLKTRHIRK